MLPTEHLQIYNGNLVYCEISSGKMEHAHSCQNIHRHFESVLGSSSGIMHSFADYFWGEKNNGFDVLYHNMKYGLVSSKEFGEFLRESCSVEESYSKLLSKLARTAGNYNTQGSFSPFWLVMKALAEKLSTLHLQLVHSWQELIKDVHRYSEEQHKKHKSMKDGESTTLDTVLGIQQTTVALHKAKETYHARCIEFEKLKRENASPKDVEKAETKYKKANEEYRGLVDKYANVRNDFEKKMTDSCQRFQELEENHLRQMKDFINTYAKAWEHQHALIGQVHTEFKLNAQDLTVDRLIETLISNKTTGREKPGLIEYEEPDMSNLPAAAATPDQEKKEIPVLEKPSRTGEDSPESSPESVPKPALLNWSPHLRGSGRWFLGKSKRDKKKEKKKKKKDKDDKDKDSIDSTEKSPRVDNEGFSIRPDNPLENHDDKNSWYSSSDSDSESEDSRRRIKVEIKPFSPNGTTPTDNVADIKKSIEGLRLSPTSTRRASPANDPNMKRSISVSDNMGNKSSQDLLSLDLFGTTSSCASTPTGVGYTFPSPGRQDGGSVTTTPINTVSATEFSIGSPVDPPVTLPAKQRSQTPTLGLSGAPLLPCPPGRSSHRTNLPTKATVRPAGRQSPAPSKMDRADSVPSLNSVTFQTTSMPIGGSRGPSPLTIGMSDTIPLAVAFSETVNAYFKGTDDSSCRVKLTGDMMVSFPSGIVKVLTDNPSPATLSFRVKNCTNLEQILVNKQLISQDEAQCTEDSIVYNFEMSSLSDHLRRQAEQNRTASYFNIDILKYQIKAQSGVQSTPLHLVTFWKCDPSQTDFRLDYKYNGAALSNRVPLTNVTVLVPVDGEVSHLQSKPTANWSPENKRCVWKLTDISDMNEEGGAGSLRAKFDLSQGPTSPSAVAVQFIGEGTTMSGIDFELAGSGYRVSLVKKRIITGKYIAESDRSQVMV